MSAHYTNITKSQMEEFLLPQGFREISLPGTAEAVYGKRVDQDDLKLTLRVYTGISRFGLSRAVGKDAIRVCLFIKLEEEKILKLGGSKRVHRVEGWKTNLQSRLDNWLDFLPKHKCPDCGSPLVPRKGKNGAFLGCTSWPTCNFSENI